MNILPKKRWHVRTKDNITRVRKDEADAAEQERIQKERVRMAEREFRTALLRKKATEAGAEAALGSTTSFSDFLTKSRENVDSTGEIESQTGHVNFFAELERQEQTFGTNKEHEEEKRQKKEEEEKKIGLLKYLGEGSVEYAKKTPWYEKAPQRPTPEVRSLNVVVPASATVVKPSNAAVSSTSKPRLRKKKKEKHKKPTLLHKKKKKRKRRHSDSSSGSVIDITPCAPATDSLEKLRCERLKREREEKIRTEQLLRGAKTPEPKNSESYEQTFNSQFNPDIARQNRRR